LILAGCYEPFPPSGAPCNVEDEGACPTGQSCIRGTCRAPGGDGVDAMINPEVDAFIPDGSPADVDADGVANATDNCADKHNPDQHDEDKDGVGDVCDNCPHVANTDQARTGESATPNGAGDACDPRPQQAGDAIQKFYSFHVPPAGTTTEGTWALDGDTYRFAGGFGALTVTGARDKVVVEVAGTLESSTPDMWLVISAGEANERYHSCGYYDCVDCGLPTDFHTALIEYYDGNGGFDDLAGNHELPQRLAGAFTIRMAADSTTDRITCTTSDARGMATSGFDTATLLTPGTVSVRADYGTVRLRYLVVFGRP
jgi:hypothetical protein